MPEDQVNLFQYLFGFWLQHISTLNDPVHVHMQPRPLPRVATRLATSRSFSTNPCANLSLNTSRKHSRSWRNHLRSSGTSVKVKRTYHPHRTASPSNIPTPQYRISRYHARFRCAQSSDSTTHCALLDCINARLAMRLTRLTNRPIPPLPPTRNSCGSFRHRRLFGREGHALKFSLSS